MYILIGKVIHGLGNGRKVGMPTANLDISCLKQDVEFGVYACYVFINGHKYKGVCNIGKRPTVDNLKTIEVNIIDFNKDIYGLIIKIELIYKLRDIIKFKSLEEVKKQVNNDILHAKEILK